MKPSTLFLGLSLAVNLVLVGLIALRPAADNSTARSDTVSSSSPARATATTGSAGIPAAKKSATPPGQGSPKQWTRLDTGDLATLVPRLRAAGFPPAVVRRIVAALVSERFDARRLEVEKANLEAPFWANQTNSYMDPKIGPELRKLQREQTEEMKRLLGGNLNDLFADSEENKAMLRQQIGNVPPEKIDQLYTVAMEYNEKRALIYTAAKNGALINADRDKLVEIEKTMRDDMGKFLTPTEVSEFMLRASDSSFRLRSVLSPIQPSEAEYRTIFPIYAAFQEKFPSQANTLSPDEAAARATAEEQMNGQIKAMLGPDRAADFQQANNPVYSQLNRLVARLELPISAATQVAAVQTDIQQRVTEVRENKTLAPSDRSAQLAALAQEASTKVSATLGASGLEAYKQYGGQWLQNLAPRPPPPPKG